MKKEYFINLSNNETQKKYLGVVSVGPQDNNYPRVYFLANKPANKMNDSELNEIYGYCSQIDWRLKRFVKHGLTFGEYTLGVFAIKI